MELGFEELESAATEDEIAAELAAARTTNVTAFVRKRPSRQPFPAHLPRERVVEAAPAACQCCGGARLRKLGEDVTETLEVIPRQWKVIQHVREKFTCRDCEKISQAPAPFHVTPRGWTGPNLLAMILFEKFGQHQPLNRQADRYATRGRAAQPLDARRSGRRRLRRAGAAVAAPRGACVRGGTPARGRHNGSGPGQRQNRSSGDVGPTCATIVRSAATAPPAAMFYYSRDRGGEHPQRHLANFAGLLQADAYGGYGQLYAADREPGPILEAACWVHARRPFFVLADLEATARRKAQGKTSGMISPIALEAVRRIDALFADRARHQRPERRATAGDAAGIERAAGRPISNAGCGSSARNYRAATISPAPSTTCSSAGPRSPASLTMDACACRTTRPNGRCGELRCVNRLCSASSSIWKHWRTIGVNATDPPDRTDPVCCPGLALSSREGHPVEGGGDVLFGPAACHAANDRQGLVGGAAFVFAGARFTQAQFGVLAALPMDDPDDLSRRLVDVDDDVIDEGTRQLLAGAHGDAGVFPRRLEVLGDAGQLWYGRRRGAGGRRVKTRLAVADAA